VEVEFGIVNILLFFDFKNKLWKTYQLENCCREFSGMKEKGGKTSKNYSG